MEKGKGVGKGEGGEEGGLVIEERPTTPSTPIVSIVSIKMTQNDDEWWRPSHPPETYKWEEVRRQRKQGGYPWTLLDNDNNPHNDDEIDANEFLDDNLYEPVNPPPLRDTGSVVLSEKDKTDTGSLDGRIRIEIPPDIEIVNSDGLDGLDEPDRYDFGLDGDREWGHSDDENSAAQTVPILFTAGIRGEGHLRPGTNKNISFDPATKDGSVEGGEEMEDDTIHQVPSTSSSRGRQSSRSRSRSRSPNPGSGPPKKTTTAFEILRSKAADAAGQVKQRFTKIALPVRPKLNQWEGVKLSRKGVKGKKGKGAAKGQGMVVEEEGVGVVGEEEPMEIGGAGEEAVVVGASVEEEATTSKEVEIAAESLQKEKEAVAEEKKRKQKEAEEAKKLKAEEKKKEAEEKKKEAEEKRKEAEEVKRLKAEEKARQKEESDKKKAEEKAVKAKAAEELKKAKLEEQLAKARDQEEQERQKNEELLKLREAEAAEKAAGTGALEEYAGEEGPLEVGGGGPAEVGEGTPTHTPTGTGSRRKKIKKTFVQLPKLPDLPQLPHIDLDFKRKVIKRSKTPPARPTPPKIKVRRGLEDTSENQLGAQYASEIEAKKLQMEEEEEEERDHPREFLAGSRSVQFPATPIFVTQPSTENGSETDKDWKSFPSVGGSEGGTDYDRDLATPEPSKQQQQQAQQQAQQPGTKERFDKFGQQLKGFGIKGKEMASKKSKAMGATMKVIGKDLQKFGVKTSEKFQATIDEIKQKQEAAKARSKEMKAKEAEDILGPHEQDFEEGESYPVESATEPRRKFRFRRRDDSQEEKEGGGGDQRGLKGEESGGGGEGGGGESGDRNQLLGRAERDWESPLELAHSRDVSEEPGTGNESPPGSSLASSTFAAAHVRKQGVLEEIDSDEFFLREKGISEGEDEEEINRFLVEELRQAFRFQENALAGFDMDDEVENDTKRGGAPQRPGRGPRKPERVNNKKEGESTTSYQTFPPERPRRKQGPGGYVSDYLKEHGDGEEDQGSNVEERGSYLEEEDLDDFGEEGGPLQGGSHKGSSFVDDGRYEEVIGEGSGVEPVKPVRRKKEKGSVEAPLYYNTVAGNDWMRQIEDQVLHGQGEETQEARGQTEELSKGRSEGDKDEVAFIDGGGVSGGGGDDDDMEYVDEAGYAVVQKDQRETPRTTPRRKKGRGSGGSKGSSLKRQEQPPSAEGEEGEVTTGFFSLPRFTPRSLHIVPPSRPQRTYSTLRPRRPPRHRASNHSLSSSSKVAKGGESGGSRPSTAIGIMQGRPLPAIPSPRAGGGDRGSQGLNDLDQSSIERAVGARHYANFSGLGGVEEPCVATNIPLLGETNIAIQTDPVEEDDVVVGSVVVMSGEDGRGGQIKSDSHGATTIPTTTPSRPEISSRRAHSATQDSNQQLPRPPSGGSGGGGEQQQYVFPRRLHLEELEVDVLRVHDLSAHSITAEHLRASQIEVNSLTSLGPLTVASIHTQTLNSDQVNCNRLASDTVDLPTVVPPSFYNLSSPSNLPGKDGDDKPEELRHFGDEGDIMPCPYKSFEEGDSLKTDNLSFDAGTMSPDPFFMSGKSLDFCLTPEQSVDNDDNSWGDKGMDKGLGSGEKKEHFETIGEEVADLPQDEEDTDNFDTVRQEGVKKEEKVPESRVVQGIEHSFRIAVLENDEVGEGEVPQFPDDDQFDFSKDEVLSGSLRLEYRRSPEVPSDFQVLHEMEMRMGGREQTGRSVLEEQEKIPKQQAPPKPRPAPPSPRSVHFGKETKADEIRKSASVESKSSTNSDESVVRVEKAVLSLGGTPTRVMSEEEDAEVPLPIQGGDLVHMGTRFVRGISRVVLKGLEAIIDYVDIATTDDPSKAEEQRAHMQVLLCLLLVLIAGIILSSNTSVVSGVVPKWEFLMPPPHL